MGRGALFAAGLALAWAWPQHASASAPACVDPPVIEAAGGVSVAIESAGDSATLRFHRGGELIGVRELHVQGASCVDLAAAARLLVEVTLEDLAFAEAPAAPEPVTAAPLPARHIQIPATQDEIEPATQGPPSTGAEAAASSARLGTTAEVGLGVALAGYASVIGSAVLDAAWAPSTATSPEVSGRAGLLGALPSRVTIDERDAWLSLIASRWDACGGVRGEAFRVRGCIGLLAGGLLAEGASSAGLVSVGVRLEGTWQASRRVGLLVAADAASIQRPSEIHLEVADWESPASVPTSPLSLVFLTGVTGDWLVQ